MGRAFQIGSRSKRLQPFVTDPAKPRFVLLERDGVINRRVPGEGVTSWNQFEFLPQALEALRLLTESNYTTLVVSNQPAVGKGLLSVRDLDAITHRFLLEVALSGGYITQVYYCLHAFQDLCDCYKPRPGLMVRAQAEHGFHPEDTFFIDDSPVSLRSAEEAGFPCILIRRQAFLEPPGTEGPLVACNLYEAAQMICAAPDFPAPERAPVTAAGAKQPKS